MCLCIWQDRYKDCVPKTVQEHSQVSSSLDTQMFFAFLRLLPAARRQVALSMVPAYASIQKSTCLTACTFSNGLRRHSNRLYVVSPVKKKKQERSFGNLPTLIFLDNEHVHPVRSMDSPKFFLSNVEHNTLFLKVAK